MRIVICGDTHFGRGYSFGKIDSLTGHNTRLLDYEKTLSDIITYTIENKIELFIFLGDIFETRSPAPHQMVIFYRQLKRLIDNNVTIFMIRGNHDSNFSRKITSSLDPLKELYLPNLHIYNNIDSFTFTDNHNESINIILMPYHNRQSYGKDTNEEALNEIRAELDIAKSKIQPNIPTICVAHMMFEDTLPGDAGEYGLNELVVPFNMFNDIDIMIAGHIHRSSIHKKEPAFIYSGSMECNDFSEREHNKVFLIYDSNKKGVEAITFMPIITRKFIDFEIDFIKDMPADPMKVILDRIENENIKDAIVRLCVRLPESEISKIDTTIIRQRFNQLEVNCISAISVVPIILKQFRNQKINEAPDHITAFRHYIASQSSVVDGVFENGLEIMNIENE